MNKEIIKIFFIENIYIFKACKGLNKNVCFFLIKKEQICTV